MFNHTKSSEYQILGPYDPCNPSCFFKWDCSDFTALSEAFPVVERAYCGVGRDSTEVAALEGRLPDSAFTVNSPEKMSLQIIRKIAKQGCGSHLIRLHCSGSGQLLRRVRYSSGDMVGRPTAKGLNVQNDEVRSIDWPGTYTSQFVWNEPSLSIPAWKSLSSGSYYQEPLGDIDGINTVFELDPLPYDETNPHGFPVTVELDDVPLESGTDYTHLNGVITFTTPPPCGSVIMVRWYTKEYLVWGLTPVALFFCDNPSCGYDGCGGRCSDGCRFVHAVFRSTIEVPPGNCGGSTGNHYAIIVTYELISGSGDPSRDYLQFIDLQILDTFNVYNPVDAVCTADGYIFILTSYGVFESCAGGGMIRANLRLPAGTSLRKLAYSALTGDVYALFGNSGVFLRHKLTEEWVIVQPNNPALAQQNHIAAAGFMVITGGVGSVVQISSDGGRQWSIYRADRSTFNILDVGVGTFDHLARQDGTYYVLTTDGVSTNLQASINHGRKWNTRNSWGLSPQCVANLEVAVDDVFLYVQLDNALHRSFNKGCKQCDSWSLITNKNATCNSIFAYCPWEPTVLVMVGTSPTEFVVDDFFRIEEGSPMTVLDVLGNDIPPIGCSINLASLTILTPAPTQGTAVVNVSGDIEYTPSPTATGFDLIRYEVEVTCLNGTSFTDSGVVRIDFFA